MRRCDAALCGVELFIDGRCYNCESRQALADLPLNDLEAAETRAAAIALLAVAKRLNEQLWFGRATALSVVRGELESLSPLVEITVRRDHVEHGCGCGVAPGDIITERHAARHPEMLTIPTYHW
jgi:hypothetical protein